MLVFISEIRCPWNYPKAHGFLLSNEPCRFISNRFSVDNFLRSIQIRSSAHVTLPAYTPKNSHGTPKVKLSFRWFSCSFRGDVQVPAVSFSGAKFLRTNQGSSSTWLQFRDENRSQNPLPPTPGGWENTSTDERKGNVRYSPFEQWNGWIPKTIANALSFLKASRFLL